MRSSFSSRKRVARKGRVRGPGVENSFPDNLQEGDIWPGDPALWSICIMPVIA